LNEPRPKSAVQVIDLAFVRSLRAADPGYRARHYQATGLPMGFEGPIIRMLRALADYVDAYRTEWPDLRLGNDCVLGEAWAEMLRGFRDLLNGNLGRLDGGALDAAVCDLWAFAGFTEEL
jgi:hypothetical protein